MGNALSLQTLFRMQQTACMHLEWHNNNYKYMGRGRDLGGGTTMCGVGAQFVESNFEGSLEAMLEGGGR